MPDISATQTFLEDVLQVQSPQSGVPTLSTAPAIAGVPAAAIQWTNQTQQFNPFPGYGSTGTKFS